MDSEQSETDKTGGGSGDQNPTVRPGQSTVRSSSIGSPTAMVQAAIGGGTVAMERIETIDTGSSTLNNLWRPNTNTNTDSSRDLATLDCKFISGFSYFSISGFLLPKKQIHPVEAMENRTLGIRTSVESESKRKIERKIVIYRRQNIF